MNNNAIKLGLSALGVALGDNISPRAKDALEVLLEEVSSIEEDRYVSKTEAMMLTGLGQQTLRHRAQEGKLKVQRTKEGKINGYLLSSLKSLR